jgi:RHS repeat-associated protein
MSIPSQDNSHRPDRLQLILFTGERMASGIPIPSNVIDLYNSEDFEWTDSLQATFTATSPELYAMIVAHKEGEDPMHLYIDNYALRQNWITTLNCDPNNPNNTFAQERRYRFGFNGAEGINELYGDFNAYDLGARMYSPRLGKMFSTDPREADYPWQAPYSYHRNSPISSIDFLGMGEPPSTAIEEWEFTDQITFPAKDDQPEKVINKLQDGTWVYNYQTNGFGINGSEQKYMYWNPDSESGPEWQYFTPRTERDDYMQKMQDIGRMTRHTSYLLFGSAFSIPATPYMASYLTANGGGAGIGILNSSFTTNSILLRAAIDGIGQAVANKWDFKKIDVFDLGLAAFTTPGVSATFGSLIDVSIDNQRIPLIGSNLGGENKSLYDLGIDFGIKNSFGRFGMGRIANGPSDFLKPYAPTLLLQNANNIMFNLPINTIGKVTGIYLKEDGP